MLLPICLLCCMSESPLGKLPGLKSRIFLFRLECSRNFHLQFHRSHCQGNRSFFLGFHTFQRNCNFLQCMPGILQFRCMFLLRLCKLPIGLRTILPGLSMNWHHSHQLCYCSHCPFHRKPLPADCICLLLSRICMLCIFLCFCKSHCRLLFGQDFHRILPLFLVN